MFYIQLHFIVKLLGQINPEKEISRQLFLTFKKQKTIQLKLVDSNTQVIMKSV